MMENERKSVLFVRDSMLAGLSEEDMNDTYQINNQCEPGATLSDLEKCKDFQDFQDFQAYDALVICVGTNDFVAGHLTSSEICEKVVQLVIVALTQSRTIKVLVLGFPFERSASNNLFVLCPLWIWKPIQNLWMKTKLISIQRERFTWEVYSSKSLTDCLTLLRNKTTSD
jgi:hypothetical protein